LAAFDGAALTGSGRKSSQLNSHVPYLKGAEWGCLGAGPDEDGNRRGT